MNKSISANLEVKGKTPAEVARYAASIGIKGKFLKLPQKILNPRTKTREYGGGVGLVIVKVYNMDNRENGIDFICNIYKKYLSI